MITKIQLPPLPYSLNALEPFLSQETLKTHYGKHHAHYVETLNHLIKKTPYEKMELEEIILDTFAKEGNEKKIYNNAAQTWNHTFYWNCLSPDRLKPSSFFSKFKDEFNKAAIDHFGSGWVWLMKDEKGTLSICSTQNSDTPIAEGKTPLLVCDLWEHAYYLDYKNEREKYLDQFWSWINWDFVAANHQGTHRYLFKKPKQGGVTHANY